MKSIALLTGRGNNSLKDKNILDVLGHPVLYYPAHSAKCAKEIDDWYCSSDDDKILNAAAEEGYKKIIRPVELASPKAQHIDAIMQALSIIENDIGEIDILTVLLANNVTVSSEMIDLCIQKMKSDTTVTAVVPVYEDNDHHPLRAKSLNESGTLEMYEKGVKGNISTNRQDLPTCYFLAHNFWVLNVKNLKSKNVGQQPWSFMGDKIVPFFINESIDIHDDYDLLLAKEWIRNNYND